MWKPGPTVPTRVGVALEWLRALPARTSVAAAAAIAVRVTRAIVLLCRGMNNCSYAVSVRAVLAYRGRSGSERGEDIGRTTGDEGREDVLLLDAAKRRVLDVDRD